ncbi:MAG: hypothetical protein AAGI52_00070 [Bacteroidota bacterium]
MPRLLLVVLLAMAGCTGLEEDRLEGELVEGDQTLESGEYVDYYGVIARKGQWIRAVLRSDDFDPYVIVFAPSGRQTDVDDSEEGNLTMTKAIVETREVGKWSIAVTTYEPGESGCYTLTYEVLDERPPDADEGRPFDADDEEEATTDA